MRTDKTPPRAMYIDSLFNAHKYSGVSNAAAIADRDEYLNNIAKISQVIICRPATIGLIAKNIPRDVATPFPPLKAKYSGNRWPRKILRAISAIADESSVI